MIWSITSVFICLPFSSTVKEWGTAFLTAELCVGKKVVKSLCLCLGEAIGFSLTSTPSPRVASKVLLLPELWFLPLKVIVFVVAPNGERYALSANLLRRSVKLYLDAPFREPCGEFSSFAACMVPSPRVSILSEGMTMRGFASTASSIVICGATGTFEEYWFLVLSMLLLKDLISLFLGVSWKMKSFFPSVVANTLVGFLMYLLGFLLLISLN